MDKLTEAQMLAMRALDCGFGQQPSRWLTAHLGDLVSLGLAEAHTSYRLTPLGQSTLKGDGK